MMSVQPAPSWQRSSENSMTCIWSVKLRIGMEVVTLIETKRPDLALLDLQMPELDGLGVVRLFKKNRTPLIAFVTAYDEHAVHAFEVNAVDYVLKPVELARLRQTIDRVKER